jgi:hypothetical protein
MANKNGKNGNDINNSAMANKVRAFGADAGAAELSRYNMAVYFGECVADKSIAIDEGAKLFAQWFDEGMCEKIGRKPAKPDSLGVLASQLKSFAQTHDHRATIDSAVKAYMVGKDRKAMNGKDFFAACLSVNSGVKELIKAEKPVEVTPKLVAAKIGKPKPKGASGGNSAPVDWVAALREAAEQVMASLAGRGAKAKRELLEQIEEMFPA